MRLSDITEDFSTVKKLLQNPSNNQILWQDLVKAFKEDGGTFLGSGQMGEVYTHPSWNFALKLYNDEIYTKFVRFAIKNPHPSFPKFYGSPREIIPNFKRTRRMNTIHIIRIEKLQPSDLKMTNRQLDNMIYRGIHVIRTNAEDHEILGLFAKNPKFRTLCEGWNILLDLRWDTGMDIHGDNIMQRDNGDYVIIDPFYTGPSIYQRATEAMKLETDSYIDDQDEPELIRGGRKYRRPKVKPPKQPEPNTYDDMPF